MAPPTERVTTGVLAANTKVEVDCDFEAVQGTTYGGYMEIDAQVRCPEDDLERYVRASGLVSGPLQAEPPELSITVRFEPSAEPQLIRCEGSNEPIPAPLPIVRQFDPSRVAYSTPEIGAIVDLTVEFENDLPRYVSGTGYALGVDCGPLEHLNAAERRFMTGVARRIGEATHAALEFALLGRSSERIAYTPKPTPTPNSSSAQPGNPWAQNQNQNQAYGTRATPPVPVVPPSIAGSSGVPAPSASDESTTIVVPPGGFGRYSALVIGVDRYDNLPALGNAVRDARAIGALLRDDYGYEVTKLENPGRAEILQALVALRRTLSDRDNLLIYYAGHGWLDSDADEGYWLPRDADREDPTHWISNDTITAQLRALRAKHVLVVADSCYSGKLVRGIKVGTRPTDYFARMAERRARVVMSSGGLEPVYDAGGRGGHSVFAAAFMAVLEENQAIVDGSTVFSRLRRPVMTNADQIPEYADIRLAGHDGGDFLFVRKGVE